MANVTCITKISTAKGLGGLASSIRYCCKGHPHNSDNHEIKYRAFVIQGWNCNDEPNLAYQDMKATLNNSYINHMNIACLRVIESFKGLNYFNKQDRLKALRMDEQFIKKKFPHNQVLIVGHIDGKNHHIHFHNLVCDRRYDNGKSVAHSASWFKTAPIMDAVLKENGYRPLNRGELKHATTNRAHGVLYHYHYDRDKSYIIWISSQIFQAKRNAKTLNEFAQNLKAKGVNVEMFKMTKNSNGKKVVKLYDKPNNKGKFKELDNGKYIRYRKHFSYSFMWHGKKLIVRERKLGSNSSESAIIQKLKYNQSPKLPHVQYKPHFKAPKVHKNPLTKHTNNHNYKYNKSLTFDIKHWNYETKVNDKELTKIMQRADKSDSDNSDSDDLSDLGTSDNIDPTFYHPTT